MMAGHDVENLLRRFKGEKINLKTISGGLYNGRVIEITNDYVCLNETDGVDSQPVFILFTAIESVATTVVSE
jgi:hypothetical protein